MQTLTKHSNSNLMKSTDEFKKTMQYVLKQAKNKGATDAAVSMHHDRGFEVDVRMNEVQTVAFSDDKALSVTVYIGHRKGSASSTDTSKGAIDAMVCAAYEIAQVSAEDACFGLADKELVKTQTMDLDLYHPWHVTPSEAIDMALSCEQQALKRDKRIINSDGVNLSTYTSVQAYEDTHGFEGVIQSSRHSMSAALIAKDGDAMQRDYAYSTARHYKNLMSPEALAACTVERATGRIGARPIKTQKVPVVFSPRVSYGLLSILVSAISGSNVYRQNTFLLDAIDELVFSDDICIHEQPYLLRGLGSAPFDGEGVPTRNNVFVDKGILKQYALGSYSARRLGLKTTANSGGVFNVTVEPTAGDLHAILKTMDTGLLVTELMGQGINILTGDYSRGAFGFWVEDGVIQYPVEEITIAGNLKQMFRNIQAVGCDINPNIATRCGSVLIGEMMIAGS